MPNSSTIRAGAIGWPVSHSLSPRLHGFWLEQYKINGSYDLIPVEPEYFPSILTTLQEKNFTGANITVPYKENMFSLLSDVDDIARTIGAVNTIWFDGAWHGTNTDAYGFMESLRASSDVWKDGVAIVLGAGGAARAVCAGLLSEGFSVKLANRTREKAEAVAQHLQHRALQVIDWSEAATVMKEASLVVNTTILGMKGQAQLDVSLSSLHPAAYVADIVYNPEPTVRTKRFSNPCITDFLARATENGHQVIDGLGMLLFQAQAGFEKWYGVKPEVTRSLRSHVLEGLFHATAQAQ